jgi:hypothetical protein
MRAAEEAKAAFPVLLLGSIVVLRAAMPALAQDQSATAPANPVAAQALEKLSATLGRPLFSPSRRPPVPPPLPVAEAAPPQPPPNLVLFGVVIDEAGARAVVRTGTDRKPLRVQIGDNIEGWKVSQIEGRKVVLSLDGRFANFTLFSDDHAKSDVAGTAMTGAEPNNSQRQIQAQQAPPQPASPQSVQSTKRRRT